MSIWSSLKEYTAPLKEYMGGDSKADLALIEADKDFEEKVRKKWHLMNSLVVVLHENVVKTNTNLTGTVPPFYLFNYLFIYF